MPRVVSFFVLLAVVLLIGSMFFQVMVQFIVPLFLAAVLVVVFRPLHEWMFRRCGPRPKLVAALTTLSVVLIVLLPLTGLLVKAVSEGVEMTSALPKTSSALSSPPLSPSSLEIKPTVEPTIGSSAKVVGDSQLETTPAATVLDSESVDQFLDKILTESNTFLEKFKLPTVPKEDAIDYAKQSLGKFAAPLALGGFRLLASTLFGLAILVLAMYYFFADGPGMIKAIMRLSPLDDSYERELLDKFGDVSRAVIVATLASAVVQGLLAGAGYYFFAGVDQVFFWTAMTIFLSMVPFVGATIVWAPLCAWLYLSEGETTYAIVLAVYCLTVVSMADNLIKPLVLHGQANLHPLLALLSVIGGVQALGPIGILVGPMLVAFLQALLNMLNKEMHLLGNQGEGHALLATVLPGATVDAPSTPKQTPSTSKQGKGKRKKK